MAHREPPAESLPAADGLDINPDRQIAQQETGGDTTSILSSRMTDVTSEGERYPNGHARARSAVYQRASIGIGSQRPTGLSTQAAPRSTIPRSGPQPGFHGSRARAPGSSAGSIGHRSQSLTSRSHVPSLASHTFFRPISSQKLQAQRGSRQFTQPGVSEDGSVDGGRNSLTSNQTFRPNRGIHEEHETVPPSRATEMTEQDTIGRLTANTSLIHGRNPAGSVSESLRPLQRNHVNTKGLNLNVDKSYKNGGSVPMLNNSQHLLSSRGDDALPVPSRSAQGREKLSSVSSSLAMTPGSIVKKSSPQNPGNNYEYFTGNTAFCWGGRIQNARHRPVNIATGLLVVVPAILFLVFSASWLWHDISPAIPILFGYVFYICLSSFVRASTSDPGILPRNLHQMPPPDEDEDPLRLAPPLSEWIMIKSAGAPNSAMEVPSKYCKTCNIWRPPRGHHCRVCDNCIETHDHHCLWLNNCIGRRNYRYFFTFVSTATVLSLFLIGASLAQILVYMNDKHISFGGSISHFRVPFAMVILAAFALPYPAALTMYHIFLIARGETTREYLNSYKFSVKDRHRPFTHGSVLRNFTALLCKPRGPTYLNFKKKYEAGDQRFGERGGKRTAPLKKEAQMALEMQHVTTDQQLKTPTGNRSVLPR